MANENEELKKSLAAAQAERDALKLEAAKLQGALEMAKDLASKSGGGGVLTSAADAAEAAKAAAKHQNLRDMRAKAMEIAGPDASHVKYVVGPSGTVRDGLGVVKPGTVIEVPVSELPAGEWKVWEPKGNVSDAKPTPPASASGLQKLSGAAEKAIAQRAAMRDANREA